MPTTIVGSFLAGLALTIAHHLFYNSLSGQPVGDDENHQLLIKGVGTALAYLVRAALLITIGSSYWQIFWDALHRKTLTVSTIDSLGNVLGALQEFSNLTILKASPLLVALAVLSWLMSFVAIVPPVTLTISPSTMTNQSNITLQVPDFSDKAAFSIVNNETPDSDDLHGESSPLMAPTYSGPTRHLMRLMMASAYNEGLPVLPPPAENSSYSQSWIGPAIQCKSIPTSILSKFTPAMGGFDPSHPAQKDESAFHYLGWVPSSRMNNIVPFGKNSIRTDTVNSGGVGPLVGNGPVGHINGGPAEIFVAARADIYTGDWTVLNCSLYNASYTANFSFTEKSQDVRVSPVKILNPVGPTDPPGGGPRDWTISASPELISYEMLMEVLGAMLCGSIWLERGRINDPSGKPNSPDILNFDRTRVLETLMVRTRELWPLYVKGTNLTEQNLSNEAFPTESPPLAAAIEGLFQNMTLALLSRRRYLKTQMEPTTVTSRISRIVYIYSARRLWLAYGLGLVLTLLVAIVGCWNVISADASYTNRFSTVLRTTRGLELDALVATDYRNGEDPVPRAIKRARLDIGGSFDVNAARNTPEQGASQSLLKGKSGAAAKISLVESS